jgi:16S rRNA G966 N2-methylase RsmD
MSEPWTFFDGRVVLHAGDCRDVLRGMADNSVDSVVTDPPYHLTSIVKRFGSENAKPVKSNLEQPANKNLENINAGAFRRLSKGFMGKQWDGGDIAFQPELWAEVLRVLKPGGYIMAFSGCRTYHRMACAIEDAGFITHPMFCYAFGSGFPKAHNLSKQIDKMEGVERKSSYIPNGLNNTHGDGWGGGNGGLEPPVTDAAREWDGWFYGTQSCKPSFEPILCGSKPFNDCTSEKFMVEFSILMEALLWLIAPAKFVEYISTNSHADQGGSVRWIALINRALSLEEPSDLMATFPSPEAASTFLSIVLLWNAILDASSLNTSTSITKTETGLIIGLKTLESWISAIMPESFIEAVIRQNGVWLVALDVELQSNVSHVFSPNIQQHSAAVSAIANSARQILFTLANIAAESSFLQPSLVGDIVRDPARIMPERRSVDLEPVYFGQKPFERGLNGAQNVMKWGVGAINVGACKVAGSKPNTTRGAGGQNGRYGPLGAMGRIIDDGLGRWPANLIHDGSEEVLACFPETGDWGQPTNHSKFSGFEHSDSGSKNNIGFGDSGSAARFFASFPQDGVRCIFYTSKAGVNDRLGSSHPTVKPLDLIQYLVRLITPKNGVCLDLFAGSGTTGEAAFREGFRSILIEREAEYIKDIERRMSLVMEGPDTRAYASMKARNKPRDDGPLFGFEENIREPNLKPSASPRRPYADDTAIWGNRKLDEAAE